MRYYIKHPIGTFIEVTEEAYEASLTESIALSDYGWDQSRFKNCPGLLSLNETHYGNKQATIKDMDGILKTITYFSSEGISLLKEIIAWGESSMLSRMVDQIEKLEASLANVSNLLEKANIRNNKYYEQVNNLQEDNEVKAFLLTVSRKNWRNKSVCKDEENCLCLHSCVSTGNCEGCGWTFVGMVADYL